MGNYDANDDYLHRLGKFVPVYVLGWIASIESVLLNFTDVFRLVGFVFVAAVAFILVYLNEFQAIGRDPTEKITDPTQRIVVVISTGLYLFTVMYRSLLFTMIVELLGQQMADQSNLLLALVVLGYTALIPYFVKKKT
jgi:hypothetical protein